MSPELSVAISARVWRTFTWDTELVPEAMPGSPSLEEVAGRRIPIPGATLLQQLPQSGRVPGILHLAIGLLCSEQAHCWNTVSIASWNQPPLRGAHTLEKGGFLVPECPNRGP